MEWTKFQNADFSVEQPVGWRVQTAQGPVTTIASPDGMAFALIEAFAVNNGDTPTTILQHLRFPTSTFFVNARLEQVLAGPANSANVYVNYTMPNGSPGRARVACVPSGARAMIFTTAAPAELFAANEPTLARIVMSFRPTSLGPPSLPASAQSASQYSRFLDPQTGTFSVEAPSGWKVRGGLNHPQPGDRRAWVEAISPQGIYVLNGDPEFPQTFCHFPGNFNGAPLLMAGGSTLLNFKPTPEAIGDYYLKKIAKGRFGAFSPLSPRPRPDVVELLRAQCIRAGVTFTKKSKLWAMETPVQINQAGVQRAGSLLTTGAFNGEYAMGMFAFWAGAVFLYIAPPAFVQQAETVRFRMMQSYEETPRMKQLVQQDEARITAAGNATNAAQQQWFSNQQHQHDIQNSFGDAIVTNYWNQQHANEQMARNWEKTQAVNDQISQNRSDAMLDRQRLADESMGKSYEVPAGFNHYWLDQQSGQIIGTDTSTPPDYQRNYTALKKI